MFSKPNLNTASIDELMMIGGMDAATAFYICRVRQIRRISSWADLAARLGLSDSFLTRLKHESVLDDREHSLSSNESCGKLI